MNRLITTGLLLSGALALSGCQQYLARQDLIVSSSGNSVATNLALQTADPWPPYVYDTYIPSSGRRAGDAYNLYKKKFAEKEAAPLAPLQLVVPQQ